MPAPVFAGPVAVLLLTAEQIMNRYRPTERPTWQIVREDFEQNHPAVMDGLRDDLARVGQQQAIHVEPIPGARQDPAVDGQVTNGHHRVLTALDAVPGLPLRVEVYAERQSPVDSHWWAPKTRTHQAYDEDDWD